MAREKASSAPVKGAQNSGANTLGVVFRSGFAGVATAMLTAAIASPAGFGGLIGVAEGMGADPRAPDAGAEGLSLPAVTQQLSTQELSTITQSLDESAAEMAAVRAATDAEIEHLPFVVETGKLQIRG